MAIGAAANRCLPIQSHDCFANIIKVRHNSLLCKAQPLEKNSAHKGLLELHGFTMGYYMNIESSICIYQLVQ